jgi:hypothetical protein
MTDPTVPHPTSRDISGMTVCWDSVTLSSETVRNILYDALNGPLIDGSRHACA